VRDLQDARTFFEIGRKSVRQKIDLAIGIAIAIALSAALLFSLKWFAGVFVVADKSIQASIVAGTFAVFGLLFTYWKERSRAIKEAHRDKKIAAYTIFYEIVFDVLKRSKTQKVELENDQNFQDQWFELNKAIIFYGSPSVLKALVKFKTPQLNVAPTDAIKHVGDVFLAMRSDIGLSNSGLDNLTIHQIYMNEDIKDAAKSGSLT
jgi:hypothetical protein